jgi:hypothetical protein
VRLEGPLEAVDSFVGTGFRGPSNPQGRRASKKTMPLEAINPKEEAVGEHQHEVKPTKKERWAPSKPAEVSTPARR